ncbi:hypothetical protein Acr_15g0011190 [Actinidia rufa]|uniref:Uncharacterized protein n=1 Tax=Actinidia rufa TaxID=165716 RepID=A0A7J0FV08_9ERIC|nr:hypothetical protein Acr_15g0011190 [Actinidia rufa]
MLRWHRELKHEVDGLGRRGRLAMDWLAGGVSRWWRKGVGLGGQRWWRVVVRVWKGEDREVEDALLE